MKNTDKMINMYCELKYIKHVSYKYYKELTVKFLLKPLSTAIILGIPTVYFYKSNGLWMLNISLIIITLILLSIKAYKYCRK